MDDKERALHRLEEAVTAGWREYYIDKHGPRWSALRKEFSAAQEQRLRRIGRPESGDIGRGELGHKGHYQIEAVTIRRLGSATKKAAVRRAFVSPGRGIHL